MSNTVIETSHKLIDQATHSADAAIQRTQRLANQVTDRTVTYVRDEPVKSMLIAAVAGAALVALASLLTRPRGSQ